MFDSKARTKKSKKTHLINDTYIYWGIVLYIGIERNMIHLYLKD